MGWYFVQVALDNPRRDANVFGVRSVVEKQVIAKIFIATTAIKAFLAWRRIGGHHALSQAKAVNILTQRDNVPGKLMPEKRWRNNHAGVITAAEDFYVR